jgi:single-strand DNA-binding protein
VLANLVDIGQSVATIYSSEFKSFWFLNKKGDCMNLVILRGNLARDPEIRSITASGRQTSVANFTIAVSREFTKQSGETDKITSFVQCEAWDTGAEAIGDSLKKGDLVMVEGSLRNDSWEKDGVKHSTMKIRVNNFGKITKTAKSNKNKEEFSEEVVAF